MSEVIKLLRSSSLCLQQMLSSRDPFTLRNVKTCSRSTIIVSRMNQLVLHMQIERDICMYVCMYVLFAMIYKLLSIKLSKKKYIKIDTIHFELKAIKVKSPKTKSTHNCSGRDSIKRTSRPYFHTGPLRGGLIVLNIRWIIRPVMSDIIKDLNRKNICHLPLSADFGRNFL